MPTAYRLLSTGSRQLYIEKRMNKNMTHNVDTTMSKAIQSAYRKGEDDELMEPIVRVDKNGKSIGRIQNGDYVIFYDIRGEREIELTESFTNPEFKHFPIKEGMRTHWASMIEYDKKLPAKVAFEPLEEIKDTLAEVVTKAGFKLAKISETEKAIHLSFFLNGKHRAPFTGEDRIAIETRSDVKNFDECPEMSAQGVADATIENIRSEEIDLIITNFANIDVLGHIENREAILTAVETVDAQVGRLTEAAKAAGMVTLITSDHGTVEKWLYPEGAVDTGHTDSPVHFIYIDPEQSNSVKLREGGSLADVAPTVLGLLGLEKPGVMTGSSLLKNASLKDKCRVLVIITDGWGHNDDAYGNLILEANTPTMDALKNEYPNTTILAAGEAVGLPDGTVGNSEAGHLHIGAGRVIYADRVRIEKAIKDGRFQKNEAFLWAMRGAKQDGTNLHLLGIISFFSSHGSIEHLIELMRMAKNEGVEKVYIHGLLGRRGERPESGARYTRKIEEAAATLGVGKVVSIIGRYWALDREENWDRVEKTYRMLVYGDGNQLR